MNSVYAATSQAFGTFTYLMEVSDLRKDCFRYLQRIRANRELVRHFTRNGDEIARDACEADERAAVMMFRNAYKQYRKREA